MGFFSCIRNAFSGKSNCPDDCDRNLADCQEERGRLTETNKALANEVDAYKAHTEELKKTITDRDATIDALKKDKDVAEEALRIYQKKYGDINEDEEKETFICSLSTRDSVCVIIAVVLVAIGVVIALYFLLRKKRPVIGDMDVEPLLDTMEQ